MKDDHEWLKFLIHNLPFEVHVNTAIWVVYVRKKIWKMSPKKESTITGKNLAINLLAGPVLAKGVVDSEKIKAK